MVEIDISFYDGGWVSARTLLKDMYVLVATSVGRDFDSKGGGVNAFHSKVWQTFCLYAYAMNINYLL